MSDAGIARSGKHACLVWRGIRGRVEKSLVNCSSAGTGDDYVSILRHFTQHLGMLRRDAEERLGRARGRSAALLPVAQSAGGNAEERRELVLGQAGLRP